MIGMSPGLSLFLLSTLFLVVGALERIPTWQFAPARFVRPYLATDVAWYLVATAASIVSTFALHPLLEKLAIPGLADVVGSLSLAVRLAIAIVVYDFVSTVIHVGMHRSDALWSVHKVHHSSLRLDWLATTRAHMFENMIRQVPAQMALFALGMHGTTVVTALVVFASFALLGHSNLRMGGRWIELVVVTPRLHRLHHLPATTQANFGTVLTLWDRLRGRLVSTDASPTERTGVPGEIDDYPQRFVAAFRQPIRERRERAMVGATVRRDTRRRAQPAMPRGSGAPTSSGAVVSSWSDDSR
jgi:sterol desaturase/sphingolipid hydroxylase (fatty acid hydroxylase superfamily)